MSSPLVLLHGFTGAPSSWDDVRGRLGGDGAILAPALLGHDGTPGPGDVDTFDDEVDRLARVVREAGVEGARVAGYSLGARVALGLLVRHPLLFTSAVLIGVNPGLAEATERAERTARDAAWARLLATQGLPTFVAAWEALPLFATQEAADPAAVEAQRRVRLAHDPAGLRRALDVLGLAAMPDWRPWLGAVAVPVSLVVGAHDAKFRALAEDMRARLQRAELVPVEGAGHNVVLERPDEVARLLQEPDR